MISAGGSKLKELSELISIREKCEKEIGSTKRELFELENNSRMYDLEFNQEQVLILHRSSIIDHATG